MPVSIRVGAGFAPGVEVTRAVCSITPCSFTPRPLTLSQASQRVPAAVRSRAGRGAGAAGRAGQGRAGGRASGQGRQSSGGSRVIALLGWPCPDPIISGAGFATRVRAGFGAGSCVAAKVGARISACRSHQTSSQGWGRRGLGATSASDCSLSNCWRFRRFRRFRRPKRRATDRPHCRPGYTPIGRN